MPVHDPQMIEALQWAKLGAFVHWLWIYLSSIIVFGFSLLTAQAIIPSLVTSGHLPEKFQRVRLMLYLVALAAFGVALAFLARAVAEANIIPQIYERWWF